MAAVLIAACVTCAPVRCSAWLAVAGSFEEGEKIGNPLQSVAGWQHGSIGEGGISEGFSSLEGGPSSENRADETDQKTKGDFLHDCVWLLMILLGGIALIEAVYVWAIDRGAKEMCRFLRQAGDEVHGRREATANDPKLSDRGVRRGTCTVGGKAAVEAGAVTHGVVRCSAWLGVAVIWVLLSPGQRPCRHNSRDRTWRRVHRTLGFER